MNLEFGYWPKQLFAYGPGWSISTLPNLNEEITYISSHPGVHNRWIFPTYGVDIQSYGTPSRLFNMPKTHLFAHESNDPDRLKFLIWVLSFFFGIRLSSEASSFLDATPIEMGIFVDFLPHVSVESAVALGEAFWSRTAAEPIQRKRLCAALHALFLARGPQLLQFEKFTYHYSALDAAYRILHPAKPDIPHSKRIEWMCTEIRIPIPSWATVNPAQKDPEISKLRNDASHEALYAGEPLGFAVEPMSNERNLSLELGHLMCRILAHILQVPDRTYIEMPTDAYGMHSMKL